MGRGSGLGLGGRGDGSGKKTRQMRRLGIGVVEKKESTRKIIVVIEEEVVKWKEAVGLFPHGKELTPYTF